MTIAPSELRTLHEYLQEPRTLREIATHLCIANFTARNRFAKMRAAGYRLTIHKADGEETRYTSRLPIQREKVEKL